ncbi:Nuclear speckle splicing regulatory protein 1 [Sparganum proliferum]
MRPAVGRQYLRFQRALHLLARRDFLHLDAAARNRRVPEHFTAGVAAIEILMAPIRMDNSSSPPHCLGAVYHLLWIVGCILRFACNLSFTEPAEMPLTGFGGKQYGLIIPGKKHEQVSKVGKSAFAEESDDEDDARFKQPNFDPKLETLKANLRKTTKVTLEKALEEDASVFQYDEVYDQITSEKNQMLMEKSGVAARKPKYVEKLLKTSAMRKLEKELLSERKAQRELEAEKEMFADKESFVTGAYKEKMSEIRRLVEQRKEEEAREEVMDVTKQDGLGGFYRFMYQQKTVLAPKVEQAETPDAERDRVAAATAGANTSASSEEKSEADSNQIKPVEKGASGDATRPRSRSRSPRRERHHHHRHQSPPIDERSSSRQPSSRRDRGDRRRDDRSSHHGSHHGDRDVRHRRRHETPSRRHPEAPSRRHNDSPSRRRSRSRDNSRSRRGGAYHHRRSPDSRRQDESSRRSRSRERAASDRDVGRRELSPSPPRRTKTPPGCIRAKPLSITDEDLAAARERYLARKAAGIHAEIASSDDDDDDV